MSWLVSLLGPRLVKMLLTHFGLPVALAPRVFDWLKEGKALYDAAKAKGYTEEQAQALVSTHLSSRRDDPDHKNTVADLLRSTNV